MQTSLKQNVASYGSPHVVVYLNISSIEKLSSFITSYISVVRKFCISNSMSLLEFDKQKRFYNAQTLNMSRVAVVDEIVKSATQALGNSFYHVLESGFNDRKTDQKTRISFKVNSPLLSFCILIVRFHDRLAYALSCSMIST